jgi:ribonuclease HI
VRPKLVINSATDRSEEPETATLRSWRPNGDHDGDGGSLGGDVPITAKYATTCGVCGSGISPGEQIAKSGNGWGHRSCPRVGRIPTAAAAVDLLEVWTAGACSGNPGPRGWAWATRDGREASGGEPATTNQRMEISAALEAARAVAGRWCRQRLDLRRELLPDGWWEGWLARGWVTSAKKPVVSRDLWQPLITLVNERGDVSFRWVKGHSGDR